MYIEKLNYLLPVCFLNNCMDLVVADGGYDLKMYFRFAICIQYLQLSVKN